MHPPPINDLAPHYKAVKDIRGTEIRKQRGIEWKCRECMGLVFKCSMRLIFLIFMPFQDEQSGIVHSHGWLYMVGAINVRHGNPVVVYPKMFLCNFTEMVRRSSQMESLGIQRIRSHTGGSSKFVGAGYSCLQQVRF